MAPCRVGSRAMIAGRSMPGQRLQDETAGGHQGAGIAGTDAGVGAAVLDEVHRHAHGRVLLLAQGIGRRLVHGDDLAGIVNLDARREAARCRCQRLQDLALPDQKNAHAGLAAHELDGRGHADLCPGIAAHGIDGDRNGLGHQWPLVPDVAIRPGAAGSREPATNGYSVSPSSRVSMTFLPR